MSMLLDSLVSLLSPRQKLQGIPIYVRASERKLAMSSDMASRNQKSFVLIFSVRKMTIYVDASFAKC